MRCAASPTSRRRRALYDAVFDAWTRAPRRCCRSTSTASATSGWSRTSRARCAPLLAFLGLAWDPKVLDNRAAAGAGATISAPPATPRSTEPIYRRAAGRWERYREQLAPVLPILAPWAERLGYAL